MSYSQQMRPNFGIEEANAVYNYMLSGGYITEHTKTRELEQILSEYIGVKHCIMTTSGTSAIILALMSLDIKSGDEVIVPNYTMIATVNSIKMVGATPVIIDVDPETYTINTKDVEKAITLKTKAVIHVSLNNRTKDLEELVTLCEKMKIYLLEDSAQSLGCSLRGKHLGTFGIMGCFSLSSPKIISTGQGGFVVTDNDELAYKANEIKNFGRKNSGNDVFSCFGLNLKFTDLQAVVGIEQMKKLDGRVSRMREMYDKYYNKLSNHVNMIPPSKDPGWIPWFIDILDDNRDELASKLKSHNIATRPTYPEVNKTVMYYNDTIFENSHHICTKGLFLPSHTLLTDEEIDKICNIIIELKTSS